MIIIIILCDYVFHSSSYNYHYYYANHLMRIICFGDFGVACIRQTCILFAGVTLNHYQWVYSGIVSAANMRGFQRCYMSGVLGMLFKKLC